MQHNNQAIWTHTSEVEGKTIMILGGVHGDERAGIEVVKKLQAQFASGELKLTSGKLILALGNLQAMEINERGSEPHRDLNRLFIDGEVQSTQPETFEQERAQKLAPHIAAADILIDLHATPNPSEPFMVCLNTPEHKRVYQWFRCGKILSDPHYLFGDGTPVTTDEYAETHGGVGFCYETGWNQDVSIVPRVHEDCLNLLKDQGLLEGEPTQAPETKETYEMTMAMRLTDVGFSYAEGVGTGSWQPIQAGQLIGMIGEEELRAENDGMLIFPTPKKHWELGKPLGYLAKRIEDV